VMSYSVLQYCRPIEMPTVLLRTVEALKVGGQALHMAVPVMERFAQANGIHFNAETEAELDARWKQPASSVDVLQPISTFPRFMACGSNGCGIVGQRQTVYRNNYQANVPGSRAFYFIGKIRPRNWRR